MPPCHPVKPVPAATAVRSPMTCSCVISDIVTLCTMRSTPAIASGSA